MQKLTLAALTLLSLTLIACGPPITSEEVLTPGPYAVGYVDIVLHDAERGRSMSVLIVYPAAPGSPSYPSAEAADVPADVSDGPHPLVVYSHGFSSFREEGTYLTTQLASHGYVVIAPTFPFTNLTAPGGPDLTDVVNQPGDVSFLIDTMLDWSDEPGNVFEGAIDHERIGATGLSLGGLTTLLVTYHPEWRDPRIMAAAATAPIADYFGPDFYDNADVPLLFNFSELDAIVDYEASGVVALQSARRPFVFAKFGNASHTAWSSIAAVLFENFPNPDTIGCAAVSGEIPDDADPDNDFIRDLLGGDAIGLLKSQSRFPCTWGAEDQLAMRPSRQHELTILTVKPFFDLYLAKRRLVDRIRDAQFLAFTLEDENAGELEITAELAPPRRAARPHRRPRWGWSRDHEASRWSALH
jgi:dienelactone hydrolase